MKTSEATTLVQINARAHARLHDLWLDLMERLLSLDYAAARAALKQLDHAISAHAALEDERAIPLLQAWFKEQTGPPFLLSSSSSSNEEEAVIVEKSDLHVLGDHKILLRVLKAARGQLEALAEQQAPLRELASVLDPFVRLQSVLEHHTTREQRYLYPVLDASMEQAAKDQLGADLLASVAVLEAG